MRDQNTKAQKKTKNKKNYEIIATPLSPHHLPDMNQPPSTDPFCPSFRITYNGHKIPGTNETI